MNIEVKKSWQFYLKAILLLLLPLTSGHAQTPTVSATCTAPTVSKTGQTANSVSFSWNAVSGATEYAVWYVRKEDNSTSSTSYTSSTSINFSGLPAGTYCFYFATVCGASTSDYIIQDDLIML